MYAINSLSYTNSIQSYNYFCYIFLVIGFLGYFFVNTTQFNKYIYIINKTMANNDCINFNNYIMIRILMIPIHKQIVLIIMVFD